MQRVLSSLTGAAVSLALIASAGPTFAGPLRPAPAVLTSDQPSAGVQTVHDRRWRHAPRRKHFSFGFGAPFYAHRYSYRAPVCPYGTWYDYRYGCVVAHRPHYYAYPYYYRSRPSVTFEFGF